MKTTTTKKVLKGSEEVTKLSNEVEALYKVTELIKSKNVKIISTTNYKSLKFYKANRDASKNIKHINSIVESMTMYGNLSVGLVAEVKGTLYILDGQHRFLACQKLGIPFDYKKVVLENTDQMVNLISSLNSNSAKWKDIDYLNAWSIEGKESYQWLKEVNEDFKSVTFSNLKNIFNWKPKQFKDGVWSMDRNQFFRGVRIVRQLNDIIPILYPNGKINAQPMRAVIDAMKSDNYNHKKMVKAIKDGFETWSNDETILRTQLFQEISEFA
jgi:hypothetical protein